ERELSRQLAEMRRRMGQLGEARQRRERRAEVLVSCPAGKTARVELTYMVGGASWQPAYEARADEAAGRVALSLYATVQQSTGERWEQAQVALSTAVPSDRKSTRLNSSHQIISYAVFCLKKKKRMHTQH